MKAMKSWRNGVIISAKASVSIINGAENISENNNEKILWLMTKKMKTQCMKLKQYISQYRGLSNGNRQ